MPGDIVVKGDYVFKNFEYPLECRRVFEIYRTCWSLNIPNILRPEYIKPSTLKFRNRGMNIHDLHYNFRDVLTIKMKIKIITTLINFAAELCKHGFVHRDIKLDNVLLDLKTEEVWIIDLETVYELGKQQIKFVEQVCGTPECTSIEQYIGFAAYASDVWQIGIFIAELLGHYNFCYDGIDYSDHEVMTIIIDTIDMIDMCQKECTLEKYLNHLETDLKFVKKHDGFFMNLLVSMLQVNYKKRPSIYEVKNKLETFLYKNTTRES